MTRFSLTMVGLVLLLAGAAQAQDSMEMPGMTMPGESGDMPQGEMMDDGSMEDGSTDGGMMEDGMNGEMGMEQLEDPCTQQVTETENALADVMQSGTLSEATTDRVYELLDRADAECADGDTAAADATLAEARAAVQ
ncbi:hypothetical protein [Methyloligella solikamskensis]|uniref:DUF305 domain-containing protein n=1 Tax=Methyloligella solikamskensis TaxID=1177756 RepID=A0ABW3J8P4_9HYPH